MVCLHLVLNKAARIRSVQSEVKDTQGAELKRNIATGVCWKLICRIKAGWMWISNKEYFVVFFLFMESYCH